MRRALSERLRGRRTEIEAAILSRVYSVSDPSEASDSAYVEGLQSAVATALEYGLAAVETEEQTALPVPPELLAQARLAGRIGVPLDTVLRRYFAGFALLGDFLIQEAQDGGLFSGETLQQMMAGLSAILDRLVAAVSDEHARAAQGATGSAEERRASHVKRLLAGEFLDASDLAYDFEGHHVALVAQGSEAGQAIKRIASSLDRRLLSVPSGEGVHWGWLGSSKRTDVARLRTVAARTLPDGLRLALGEPAEGMEGWRLTHRQARAALPIAVRDKEPVVRYADVALIASIASDELLVRSLRQLYLKPLSEERDGGKALLRTLQAYFAAEGNVSSAAAALGVDRKTVTNRLRLVEQQIGRPVSTCAMALEAALQIEHPLGEI